MDTTAAATPLPLVARMIGVLFSPRDTFANVAAFPRWLGVMAVSLGAFALASAIFLSTPVGQQALLDQQVAQLEGFGQTVNDEMYARLQGQAKMAPYFQGVAILLFAPVFTAVFSGVLFGVFSGMLGGQASFKQVFAVLAHTSVLNLVQALFITPLNYVRGSLSSATSFGVFLPMLPEGSFLANFLGAIDLFILWSIGLTSIGLAVLYRRRTPPIFISLVVVYLVIALAIAAVKASLGGS
jgi:hypothetical protein